MGTDNELLIGARTKRVLFCILKLNNMNFVGNCIFASNIAGVLIGSCKFCLFNCCDTEEGMLFPGLPRFCSSVCVQYDSGRATILPLLCIILNANRRTKKWGRAGDEAMYVCFHNHGVIVSILIGVLYLFVL